MSKTYLLTRPEHDDTTYYLSNWIVMTVKTAENHGFKVLDMHREKATKINIEAMIKDFSPNLVVFNGHGSQDTVTGHDNKPLITCGVNEGILKSKIVYAISCKSAHILGPKSVAAGATSYTGYDNDFIFLYDPDKYSRPHQDETAKAFLWPSNLFVESLLKGNTVGESKKRAEYCSKDNIRKALSSVNPDPAMARYLWWNLRHFVSHGDVQAKV
jgi:hypothetical protein